MPKLEDPTEPIRLRASKYPEVDEGTSCTQSSFRAGKKAFLFIGQQGGRYKAMFKLKASLPEAQQMAKKAPDDFQVGSWVTARFSAEKPLPKTLWQRWLDESYELHRPKAKAAPKKKPAKKKAAKKTAQGKPAARKKTVRKK
ncbi:MAG: MmcQ/YjbR family DNA-binding protein [Planctomycetota bacterium]